MGFDRAIGLIAARQHGVFTYGDVVAASGTRQMVWRRVTAGRWLSLGRGVYRMAGTPATWRQRLLAAVLAAGQGAVASGRSAAALWGLPGFREGPLEISRPEGLGHRPVLGAQRRPCHLPDHHVTVVDGIAVTTIERTLFDLA